jgi:2',3'-cyclic-nucleotide 2'-phosphodiesterase (5'-nucleotidase family)
MKAFWSLPFLVLLTWGEACAEKEIVIIGTADVHGRLTPVDYYSGTGLSGSLARVYTLVRGLRAENPYTLLVDSGDLLQDGPLEEIYLRGVVTGADPVAKVTNFMGYDAVVVGNHDLDFGLDALFTVSAQCRYPWLAANVRRADTGERPFQAHVVKDMAGVRVAVIGLTNQGPAVWMQGGLGQRLLFVDPVEEARVLVPEIRDKERADLVVVLAHGGVGESPWAPAYHGYASQSGLGPENFAARLAREVAGIDVVLAGHTHEEVPSHWIDDCLVVQSGKGAAKVAVVRVAVESEGDRTVIGGKRAELLSTQGTAPSEEILALVREDELLVYSHLAQPLGLVSAPLDAASCRVSDNAVVDLIHKVQLLESGAQVSAAACFVEDFRLPAGEVNLADLHNMYPYPNTLVAVEMTGGEIKDYLERAASYFPRYDFSGRDPEQEPLFAGYQYDTLEGVEYELDITKPVGKRVTHLMYRGRPLRRDALLKVALNSYRRGGGGGYPGVTRAPLVYDRQQDIPSLLADYIRRVALLQPVATANWHLVPDYLSHWARERVDYLYQTGLVEGRRGVFRPQDPATTREVVEWLAGTHEAKKSVKKRFRARADSLGLDWKGALARLEALRLLFACVVPETSACRQYEWRLRDWDNLSAGDQVVVGTAVARGWLVDTPWEVADTLAPVSRGEAASLVFSTRFRELTLAATNDLHGGLQGRITGGPTAAELGGIARIGGLVDSLRHANPGGVVLLDVGDLMQGTLVSNTYRGSPVIEAFNLMGYDAAALGNHEFDWGQAVLRDRIAEAHFPVLSANTVLVDSGVPPSWIEPSALLERADLRVGVVGLSPPEMPYIVKASHLEGLAFLEPAEPAQREADRLREAGANVVIVAAHIGVERTESGGWTGSSPGTAIRSLTR